MPRGTLRRVSDSRRVYYSRLYYRLIDGPRLLQGGAPGRRRKTGKAPLLGNHLLLDLSHMVPPVELPINLITLLYYLRFPFSRLFLGKKTLIVSVSYRSFNKAFFTNII